MKFNQGVLLLPDILEEGKSLVSILRDVFKKDITVEDEAYEIIQEGDFLPLHYHTTNVEFLVLTWEFTKGPGRKFVYLGGIHTPTVKDVCIILPNNPSWLHGTTVQMPECDTKTKVTFCNKQNAEALWHRTYDQYHQPL